MDEELDYRAAQKMDRSTDGARSSPPMGAASTRKPQEPRCRNCFPPRRLPRRPSRRRLPLRRPGGHSSDRRGAGLLGRPKGRIARRMALVPRRPWERRLRASRKNRDAEIASRREGFRAGQAGGGCRSRRPGGHRGDRGGAGLLGRPKGRIARRMRSFLAAHGSGVYAQAARTEMQKLLPAEKASAPAKPEATSAASPDGNALAAYPRGTEAASFTPDDICKRDGDRLRGSVIAVRARRPRASRTSWAARSCDRSFWA